jgi:uncharacterized membrane protein YqjE
MFEKIKEILKKKHLDEDKVGTEFEKGDFLALLIAMGMTMFPVLIGLFAIFALVTWLIFT